MEKKVTVVIPIEYSDRSLRDIVLTLESNHRNNNLRQGRYFVQHLQRIGQTHAAYMCMDNLLLSPHGTYE